MKKIIGWNGIDGSGIGVYGDSVEAEKAAKVGLVDEVADLVSRLSVLMEDSRECDEFGGMMSVDINKRNSSVHVNLPTFLEYFPSVFDVGFDTDYREYPYYFRVEHDDVEFYALSDAAEIIKLADSHPKTFDYIQKQIQHHGLEGLEEVKSTENIMAMINNNFSEKDTWATLTYSKEEEPTSREQAESNLLQFVEQLKSKQPKESSELKYVGITHFNKETAEKVKTYHHVIVNFADKEALEGLWSGGGRVMARRLKFDAFGSEGLVRFVLKGKADRSLITNISERSEASYVEEKNN